MYFLFFAVSLIASIIGSICGIGGGVIIKPALDAFSFVSVAAVSFLSGCTVLSMSCYSVLKGMASGDSNVDVKTATPLAVGAAVGGVAGKSLFEYTASLFTDANRVGAVQAGFLILITAATLLYTVRKDRIHTLHTRSVAASLFIGFMLGIMSSFLGIGGGPINLVVLAYFFSMNIKKAAQNSLYIILFSQATNLISTILTARVPSFNLLSLALMVAGGIVGGVVGRMINKKIHERAVNNLFIALMIVIIGINIYNVVQFIT